MLTDILAYALLAFVAVVAIGFALLPLCLLSGVFAWMRSNKLQRKINETEQLLAEK